MDFMYGRQCLTIHLHHITIMDKTATFYLGNTLDNRKKNNGLDPEHTYKINVVLGRNSALYWTRDNLGI